MQQSTKQWCSLKHLISNEEFSVIHYQLLNSLTLLDFPEKWSPCSWITLWTM